MRGLLDRMWAFGGGPNRAGNRVPFILGAEVGDTADDELNLTYSESLDGTSVPATGDYSLSGTSRTISSVGISGAVVTLTLSGDIINSETVLVDYTAGVNPVMNSEGGEAVDLVNYPVVNNTRSQYIVYTNNLVTTPASTIYSDGTYEARKRIAANVYYIDVGITPTGFDGGAEDVDWTWMVKLNGQDPVFRSGVRGGDFVVDCEITVTGFAGTIDVDWENLTTVPGGGVETTYRDGVRDAAYVIDKALDATGFAGTEDVNWENLRKYKPE